MVVPSWLMWPSHAKIANTLDAVAAPVGDATRRLDTAELLFASARQMGLGPTWVVPHGLFAVVVDGREEYVHFARSPLNSDVSVSLAKNKYLTRKVLSRHGIRNIPFIRPQTLDVAQAFLATHGTIVAKPLTGSGSRDVHIITKREQLSGLDIYNYILEKYIAGKEMRYLVLNGVVIAVHESDYGSSVAVDRALRRISYSREAWDARLIEESLQIADVLSLQFTAVDYLVDDNGQHHLLEVNTMPGLKWFHAPTTGPAVDVARSLLEALYMSETRYVSR